MKFPYPAAAVLILFAGIAIGQGLTPEVKAKKAAEIAASVQVQDPRAYWRGFLQELLDDTDGNALTATQIALVETVLIDSITRQVNAANQLKANNLLLMKEIATGSFADRGLTTAPTISDDQRRRVFEVFSEYNKQVARDQANGVLAIPDAAWNVTDLYDWYTTEGE